MCTCSPSLDKFTINKKYLSLNFGILLAENVPNTGSHTFNVPPIPPVIYGRLMVKASDNVFFESKKMFEDQGKDVLFTKKFTYIKCI